METVLILAPIIGIIALLFALSKAKSVAKADPVPKG